MLNKNKWWRYFTNVYAKRKNHTECDTFESVDFITIIGLNSGGTIIELYKIKLNKNELI